MNALNIALFSIINLSLILSMTHSPHRIGLTDRFGYWITVFVGVAFAAMALYERYETHTGQFDRVQFARVETGDYGISPIRNAKSPGRRITGCMQISQQEVKLNLSNLPFEAPVQCEGDRKRVRHPGMQACGFQMKAKYDN